MKLGRKFGKASIDVIQKAKNKISIQVKEEDTSKNISIDTFVGQLFCPKCLKLYKQTCL